MKVAGAMEYFKRRMLNDEKRLKSFKQELKLIDRFQNRSGSICDVGCSTGEFIETINWLGPRYGMEISEYAMEQSRSRGISFEKNIMTE